MSLDNNHTTLQKLLDQRKAIDAKIAAVTEKIKQKKQTEILAAIKAAGLEELQDEQLRQVLANLKAAGGAK